MLMKMSNLTQEDHDTLSRIVHAPALGYATFVLKEASKLVPTTRQIKLLESSWVCERFSVNEEICEFLLVLMEENAEAIGMDVDWVPDVLSPQHFKKSETCHSTIQLSDLYYSFPTAF